MVDDIDGLRRVLAEDRVIAVVGLSANWYRPSYFAAKYMQGAATKVIPVNPAYREVLGEVLPEPAGYSGKGRYGRLLPQGGGHPSAGGGCDRDRARTLWLQLGVINHEAAAKGRRGRLARGDGSLREDRVRQIVWWPGLVRGQYQGDFIPPSACRPARLDPEREQFGGQRGVIGDPRPRAAEMCLRSLDPEAADIDAVETKQWQLARIAAGRASVIPQNTSLEPEAGGQLVVGVVSPVVEVAGDDEGRITGGEHLPCGPRGHPFAGAGCPRTVKVYADAVRIDR